MQRNSLENLIHLPIQDNVTRRYGKYTKKINGQLVKVVYDWFDRQCSSQYKLELIKEQYDRMQSFVCPIDAHGEPLTFDQFCDILIPVITGSESDKHDDYAICLAFHAFDKNNDRYIQADELEALIHIIGKSISRERIRFLLDQVDWDHNGQLDYQEFRQFIIRGYARELLMMDITRDIVYSNDPMAVPGRMSTAIE